MAYEKQAQKLRYYRRFNLLVDAELHLILKGMILIRRKNTLTHEIPKPQPGFIDNSYFILRGILLDLYVLCVLISLRHALEYIYWEVYIS